MSLTVLNQTLMLKGGGCVVGLIVVGDMEVGGVVGCVVWVVVVVVVAGVVGMLVVVVLVVVVVVVVLDVVGEVVGVVVFVFNVHGGPGSSCFRAGIVDSRVSSIVSFSKGHTPLNSPPS